MCVRARSIILAILISILIPAAIKAHYHVLVPKDYGKWRARKGEAVPYRLIWGHGYEHIWFDIKKPISFVALDSKGTKTDLLPLLEQTKVAAVNGKEYLAYSFEYKPGQRGDHVLALEAGRQWDEEGREWLRDFAKAVLHVQAESGWNRPVGHPLELIPLSRPYGLVPGDVVRFQLLSRGKPAAGARVERELFSESAPAASALPCEEFIAYPALTDGSGIVSFTFPGPGWYGITAMVETGKTHAQGSRQGPVMERATFWVYVCGSMK